MINSLNSNYSNLNIQNKNLNPIKESNLSKPSSNHSTKEQSQEPLINPSNKLSNSVNDKTQAVSKILGYGVDKDGYFTSDFNEAAGIPKDYKIYAKDMQSFENKIGKGNTINDSLFTGMDIAKTLGNTYKLFSQLIPDDTDFTKDKLENIPKWFQYDNQSFEIIKIYENKDALMNIQKTKNDFKTEVSLEFNFKANQKLDKGETLLAFLKGLDGDLYWRYGVIVGDTTILGKLGGLDRNMSFDEIKDLNNFLSQHPINHVANDELMKQTLLLPMKMSNIEDFKKEWLKLETQNKQSLQENQSIDNQKITLNTQKSNESTQNPEDKKPFKPIQGESQNKETYKDNNISHEFLKKLLKNSFNQAKELEILLGMKMSDEEGELNSFLLKKNLQSIKGVDIKA